MEGFGLVVIDNMASVLTPMLEQGNFNKLATQIQAVKCRWGPFQCMVSYGLVTLGEKTSGFRADLVKSRHF